MTARRTALLLSSARPRAAVLIAHDNRSQQESNTDDGSRGLDRRYGTTDGVTSFDDRESVAHDLRRGTTPHTATSQTDYFHWRAPNFNQARGFEPYWVVDVADPP